MWVNRTAWNALQDKVASLDKKQEEGTNEIKKAVKNNSDSLEKYINGISSYLHRLEYQANTDINSQITIVPRQGAYLLEYKTIFMGVAFVHSRHLGYYYSFTPNDKLPNSNEDFDNSWDKYHEILDYLNNYIELIMQDKSIARV